MPKQIGRYGAAEKVYNGQSGAKTDASHDEKV
jgi:hypothetical protein